ncbi:hypothetical protein ILYODFUR_011935, partial [Ilyodon furcidens]
ARTQTATSSTWDFPPPTPFILIHSSQPLSSAPASEDPTDVSHLPAASCFADSITVTRFPLQSRTVRLTPPLLSGRIRLTYLLS